MITIHQIRIDNRMVDAFNTVHGAPGAIPAIDARRRMSMGASEWSPEYMKFYAPMYEVDTDDLDEAFEWTNLWNAEDRVNRLNPGSSSSVGDLFEKDGVFYIVDDFGFKEIESLVEETYTK
jgi:hypothetical protein